MNRTFPLLSYNINDFQFSEFETRKGMRQFRFHICFDDRRRDAVISSLQFCISHIKSEYGSHVNLVLLPISCIDHGHYRSISKQVLVDNISYEDFYDKLMARLLMFDLQYQGKISRDLQFRVWSNRLDYKIRSGKKAVDDR